MPFRGNPLGEGSKDKFLLLFSHVSCVLPWLYFVHCLSSSCVFCDCLCVYFCLFYWASFTLSISVSLFLHLFFLICFLLPHCLPPSVFPDSGLSALYYMLTLLHRLGLAIIGRLVSSSYAAWRRRRERKGRA